METRLRSLTPQALLFLVMSQACGEPLAPGAYAGVPRLTIYGQSLEHSTSITEVPGQASHGRLGIFWAGHGLTGPADPSQLVEQPSNGVDLDLPGRIVWSLYDLPGAEDLITTSSGASFAVGYPFLYDDANGNRQLDPGETLIGDDPQLAVVYAPQALAAADAPSGIATPAGFHLELAPMACGLTIPPPPPGNGAPCAVPLGGECAQDSDCGGSGVCFQNTVLQWPGGYCAVAVETGWGCQPADAVLFPSGPPPAAKYWVKACRQDSDCGRTGVYQCDLGRGACLPSLVINLALENVEPHPVCATPPMMTGG